MELIFFSQTERASECESHRGMAMALESWSGLRLGLMALGYQQVIWTHLHCVTHGVFKVAIAEELEEYPCPTCQQACKVAIVAQGFTKYALPLLSESANLYRPEHATNSYCQRSRVRTTAAHP